MAVTLDPRLAKTNPTKSVGSNPISNTITAAVQSAKPITVPKLPFQTSKSSLAPTVQKSTATTTPTATPAPTTAAPATSAPKTSAPATGALNYNTATTAQKQGMQDNWARLNSDSDYLTSEIARAQAKIAAPGTSAQDASAANDYLTKLTGIASGSPSPTMGTSGNNNFGLPSDLSWLGASGNAEIAAQIAAYQGQQEAARQAAQFGVDQNNQYLSDQIKQFQQQKAVDLDSLQQQQNRFGGLYSGGLNYQGGQINSSYTNQEGALSREIAARNQQLLDQYGTQANTIASQIQKLQSNQPSIVRDRINDYLTQYAGLYGSNPLNPNQSTLQGKQANWNAYTDATNLFGNTGQGPTNVWSNLIANGNAGNPTYQAQQQQWENDYQVGRDKVEDSQWQSGVDQDIYKLLYDQANAGGKAPSVSNISTNINRALSAMGNDVDITNPTVRNQIDQIILTQTQDPNTIAQLYAMYGIPIPDDLQAELSGK